MKSTILFFTTFFIFGCSSDKNQPLLERAELVLAKAQQLHHQEDFSNSNPLLVESAELFRQLGNSEKLNTALSLLAPTELHLGKLSSAIDHYSQLFTLSQQSGDREGELRNTLHIGNLYKKLGNTRNAIALYTKASQSADVLNRYDFSAEAKILLGEVYCNNKEYSIAIPILKSAIISARLSKNGLLYSKALQRASLAYAKSGDYSQALKLSTQSENLTKQLQDKNAAINFYLQYAQILISLHDWESAATSCNNALALLSRSHENEFYNERIISYFLLGEIFFANFDFITAFSNYEQMLELTRKHQDNARSGFAFIRMGDCALKEFARTSSNNQSILASQRYEQAFSSFARINFVPGEGVALARLADCKKYSGDISAAITLYKRAFANCSSTIHSFNTLLFDLDGSSIFAETFFSDGDFSTLTTTLVSLLLKQNRIADAYTFFTSYSSIEFTKRIHQYKIEQREPEQQQIIESFVSLSEQHVLIQSEVLYQNEIPQTLRSREFAIKKQSDLQKIDQQQQDVVNNIIKKYPSLSPIVLASSTTAQLKDAIPDGHTLLEYFFSTDHVWVFVSQHEKETTVLKISSFSNGLKLKMEKMIELLHENPSFLRNNEVKELSNELYGILIRPIEAYGEQRFVFVLPHDTEQFPMHALIKNGRPLIDLIEVSYLPHSSFLSSITEISPTYSSATAIGYSTETKWGLEFELRDMRSFIRNTTIYVGQQATEENLTKSSGDLLQLSTSFYRDGNYSPILFTLSTGAVSSKGTRISAARLGNLFPFRSITISNLLNGSQNVDCTIPSLVFFNRASNCIVTLHSTSPRLSKRFSENYYSTLSSTNNSMNAYQFALRKLSAEKDLFDDFSWATYFYFGK